jgi:membrane protease YdiL (CAAX protease family)
VNAGDSAFCPACGREFVAADSQVNPVSPGPNEPGAGDSSPAKRCGYCGRENKAEAMSCAECGTPFPPTAHETASSPVPPELPGLAAGRATMILVIYLIAQFGGAMLGGVLGVILNGAQSRMIHNPQQRAQLMESLLGPAMFVAVIAGGAGMILGSLALVGRSLSDNRVTGAAWKRGTPRQLSQGLAVGMILGTVFVLAASLLQNQVSQTRAGLLARMAATPGLSQLAWVIMALFLAPLIEELLFRGVLYGGYRKTFGSVGAAVSTTLLFVFFHITEAIYFWPAFIFIAGMASVALWVRLRSGAIGPAVAVHFGYNAMVAVAVMRAG